MLQLHARCTGVTTIIKLIILSLMVHAGYFCVAIIHCILMWTTGSLSCTQMLMYVTAHASVWTRKETALKVDSRKKIPCRTGESNQRQLYIPSLIYDVCTTRDKNKQVICAYHLTQCSL